MNLIGKRFGRLIVLSISKTKDKRKRWKCKCDCGNIKIIRHECLTQKLTKSCGCLKRGSFSHQWKGYKEISNHFYSMIKFHAKSKNRKFNITINQIWKLFIKQNRKCALSGLPLKFPTTTRSNDGTASLDRIDSSKGYTIHNVQWIHKDINKIKSNFDEQKFLEYCKFICINKKLL